MSWFNTCILRTSKQKNAEKPLFIKENQTFQNRIQQTECKRKPISFLMKYKRHSTWFLFSKIEQTKRTLKTLIHKGKSDFLKSYLANKTQTNSTQRANKTQTKRKQNATTKESKERKESKESKKGRIYYSADTHKKYLDNHRNIYWHISK